MKARYVYASTLVKTRAQELLNDTQLEMLLTAKSPNEMITSLHDTYLAPYLSGREGGDVSYALEKSVADARTLLERTAPDPRLLDVLWIKYDFYNLRTIIKGGHAGIPSEDILKQCFTLGLFEPARLLEAYHNNTLSSLNPRLNETARAAATTAESIDIEQIIQSHYFRTAHEMAQECKNSFVRRYIETRIDLFNTLSHLRELVRREHTTSSNNSFVAGGTFNKSELETKEDTIAALYRLGGEHIWREALDAFNNTGTFLLLEKTADEYILTFLDRESFELFSLAPLYAYFTAVKNNAQTIRAIWIGKNRGLSEHDVRHTLRKL